MKKQYIEPKISVHTVELTIMAASGTDFGSNTKDTGIIDGGEDLGAKGFDFLEDE